MKGNGIVVVGAQFGDEGKGKIVDMLAESADVIVRYAGGGNAGHTIVVGERTFKLHLLPSGVVRGKRSLMAAGMVIDPRLLAQELDELMRAGITIDPLILGIDVRAHLILPHHQSMELARSASTKAIGTTGKGIGPAYEDAAARSGLRFADFADKTRLAAKLPAYAAAKKRVIEAEAMASGATPSIPGDESVLEEYAALSQRLAPYACDASAEINESLGAGRTVIFEGAQGTFLDKSFGTYPFVTSSHPLSGGACVGAGVGPSSLTEVHGVVKAYSTRVGGGPFPTELAGDVADRLVEAGKEFGTTTGRRRRVGWLDACMLSRSQQLNGFTCGHLTKLDVLGGFSPLLIATSYTLPDGSTTTLFPADTELLDHLIVHYTELPGFDALAPSQWREVARLGASLGFAALPPAARAYVHAIGELTGIPLASVSVGPGRDEVIWANGSREEGHADAFFKTLSLE